MQLDTVAPDGQLVLCDTHCHIHDDDYALPADAVLSESARLGVHKLITMGSNLASDRQALAFASQHDGVNDVMVRVGVGLYPHEVPVGGISDEMQSELLGMVRNHAKLVAGIGEIGLDYYYDTVPRERQIPALETLLQLAVDNNLPVSLHVRSGKYGDAFADFLPILNNFGGRVRGVLHSFTDNLANLDKVLTAGLYVGVNGILTFNRDEALAGAYQAMPLERIVLETDAPYLAPKPYRGKVNQPGYIRPIAEALATLRGLSLEQVAEVTTANAVQVYSALA